MDHVDGEVGAGNQEAQHVLGLVRAEVPRFGGRGWLLLLGVPDLLHEVESPVGILDHPLKLVSRDAQLLTDDAHGRRLDGATDSVAVHG